MPVFALYNFDDADTTARDSALGNGAQDGIYINGAAGVGGQLVLDGVDDLVKIYPNPMFQMDRGTLDISFTLGTDPLTGTQTVLSRACALPMAAAEHYGHVRATLQQQGQPIGNNDLWLAAHALAEGWTLVTNNTREFTRVPGLRVENWVE